MKIPCELFVTYILPTAKGSLARELVTYHDMTQVQVAKLFGVTSAAVSQYMKGVRGGDSILDKSAYRDDFYKLISDLGNKVADGMDVGEALCIVCQYTKDSGLLKALYVLEGYESKDIKYIECPTYIVGDPYKADEHRLRRIFSGGRTFPAPAQRAYGRHHQMCR